jgi:esterase/lipase
MDADRTSGTERSAARTWLLSLAAGLGLALAALAAAPIAGLPLRWIPSGDPDELAALTLFAGVLIAGTLAWWLLVARRRREGWWPGAVAGVYAAGFSYPVVIILAQLFQDDWLAQGDSSTLLARLSHGVALSIFGLLTTGFAAMVILGLAGMAIGAMQRRLVVAAEPGMASRKSVGLLHWLYRGISGLALALIAVLTTIFLVFTVMPLRDLNPSANPAPLPAASYKEAIATFESIQREEAGMQLHPRCGTQLLTHGQKVDRVVIFFHGLTNCPAQADELAATLFDLGHNVLLARLPGHGEADPMTEALAYMTAEGLVETATRSVALATGLGNSVEVVGLSAGGTMAMYVAQQESRANAFPLAPFLAPLIVPPWATPAATNLLLWLPNMMVWWDADVHESPPAMDYAYPRFATRALAEIMRLGRLVDRAAATSAPASPHIGVMLNAADEAVNNTPVERVVAAWRQHGHTVDLDLLPLAYELPHDLIDPRQPDADTELVYPRLIEMLSRTGP